MPWLLRHCSASADESKVLVARGDALNVAEAGVLEHRHQLVDHALAARVAEDRKQMAEGGVAVRGEVHRHEAAAGLEDTPYLGEPRALEVIGQVVQHEAAGHQVERGSRERE